MPPENAEDLNSLNINDDEIKVWFEYVIDFTTKHSLLVFLFSIICIWDVNFLSIFICLIIYDIIYIITNTAKYVMKKETKFVISIKTNNKVLFNRKINLRENFFYLFEKISFITYYVKFFLIKI